MLLCLECGDVGHDSRFVSGRCIEVDNAFLGRFIDDGLRAIDQGFGFRSARCRQHLFQRRPQQRARTFIAKPGFLGLAQAFF